MEFFLIVGAFLIGFVMVIISVPSIVRVANAKHLFDPFSKRKIHTKIVPPLGGVAIFIGLILGSIIATDGLSFDNLKYIIASIILIFFIGLKDDLINVSAKKKLVVQLFAAIMLVTLGNVHFTNLHGIFGIYEIHYLISISLTIVVMIGIINAFNLIDGIDGLASGLGILLGAVFGFWFYLAGHIQFSIMAFALVGSLSAFFIFNVFGNRYKLFMGDAGSMIIGLVISTLLINFNQWNIIRTGPFAVESSPVVSLAIVIVPIIDTIRIIIIRIINNQSPFSADANHIHHKLLLLIPSHLKVTLIILTVNVFIIIFSLFIIQSSININIQFLAVFLVGGLFSQIPSIILNSKYLKRLKLQKENIR